LPEIRRFVVDCMMAVGTPKNNAEKLAENIVEADYRGFYGHGLNRLGTEFLFYLFYLLTFFVQQSS
jgi:LDH2 family malate/lactate/ureidoglycolate dehydrogenase